MSGYRDLPEHLRGELRFYWVDTGHACGLVVVNADRTIVDCAPFWRRWFLGRGFEEIVQQNPDAGIRWLPGVERGRVHAAFMTTGEMRMRIRRRTAKAATLHLEEVAKALGK